MQTFCQIPQRPFAYLVLHWPLMNRAYLFQSRGHKRRGKYIKTISVMGVLFMNKVYTLHDAVAKFVESGDCICFGGFTTNRKPYAAVGEILRLTEGSLAPVACLDGDCKGCSRSDECPTLDVWKNLDKLINDYLDGVTLDQLVAPNHGYDYVI